MESEGVIRERKRRRKESTQSSSIPAVAVPVAGEGRQWMGKENQEMVVGRYVLKEFDGNGVFLGKIVEYDMGLYRVEYEDGDSEDMDVNEVGMCLVGEEYFDEDLMRRRRVLDSLVDATKAEARELGEGVAVEVPVLGEVAPGVELVKGGDEVVEVEMGVLNEGVDGVEPVIDSGKGKDEVVEVGNFEEGVMPRIELDKGRDGMESMSEVHKSNVSEIDDEMDSCSGSCDFVHGCGVGLEGEMCNLSPPELPPSSGTIGVPEECVPNLFSVYCFLRSFGSRLFLSPFTLDDLVGCLNCADPSSLLDAIHVALLRALRKYLEAESSNGSELASKCLRSVDWVLLDTLTWPVYLVHYLTVMGYIDGVEWKEFCINVLEKPYCTLPVWRKLMVIQILCDDALESADIRTEIDLREESEIGIDADGIASVSESGPRRVHPKCPKTFAGNTTYAVDTYMHMNGIVPTASGLGGVNRVRDGAVAEQDGNGDECRLCGMDGTLLCCDGCPSAYHSRCIGVSKVHIPEGSWFCPECTVGKTGPRINVGTSLQGAELFGTDSYEQVFLGTCNHLLVIRVSVNTFPFVRYYNFGDISKVLRALQSSEQLCISYSRIARGILKYWEMPQAAFPTGETIPKNTSDLHLSDSCFYLGFSFKPHVYINHFVHGDFAASAAVSFAVLSSEENQRSEVQASSNPRKVMSACISLQAKAFSLAAIRFFWPNPDKKLLDFPRERCSWCLNCKSPCASKRGCLLNASALTATKEATKIISKLSLTKNVESDLYGIAIYTLYMEEALRGLVVGPFLNASHREQWCKQVGGILSFSEIKKLLLQLEENVRTIALSGEWFRAVDNSMSESSASQTICPVGPTQKRGPGRPKKHLTASDVIEDTKEESTDFTWYRGGKLSKLVFQKGMLPHALLRKAARQGGSRRFPGIHYPESADVPKRSRQLTWRVAVEMSKNTAHLALQIRYLDHHIRWSDLIPPEQNQDIKGSETEVSVFRNACVCDKKHVDDKIMYGVIFEHQRHLPSRLMKSIMGKEENQNGKEKYWFLEARVPLYLIREYEKAAGSTELLPTKNPPCTLSNLQKRQLKASRKDIFSYLVLKRDNLAMCSCASCHSDVFLSNAANCSACEGYCHRGCTMNSLIQTSEGVEFIMICKNCYQGKAIPKNRTTAESPTSPLAMQGQEYQNPSTVYRCAVPNTSSHQPLSAPGTSESSESKTAPLDSSVTTKSRKKKRFITLGPIWKKKNIDGAGSEFRLNHVLLRSASGEAGIAPVCHLCQKPYDPQLMYIHCSKCQEWFHADAVGLDESKLDDLVGFKCCKCRRMRPPLCPRADLTPGKVEAEKSKSKASKRSKVKSDSVYGTISELTESSIPATPLSLMDDDIFIQVDDSILFSASDVKAEPEQITDIDPEWDTPYVPGPQKLSVRRYLKDKPDNEISGIEASSQVEFSESDNFVSAADASSRSLEWDYSGSGHENGLTLDYQSFDFDDFEPQTFFSFGELLDPDVGQLNGGGEAELLPSDYMYWDSTNPVFAFQDQSEVGTSNEHMGPVPMEQFEQETFNEHLEPVPFASDVPCGMCSQTAPTPDLSCPYCGLQIHSQCSPWENFLQEEIWVCGNCRAWP